MKKVYSPYCFWNQCFLFERKDINRLIMAYNDIQCYLKDKSLKEQLADKYYNMPSIVDFLIKSVIGWVNAKENFYKDPQQSKEALDILEKFKDPKIQQAYYDISSAFKGPPKYVESWDD